MSNYRRVLPRDLFNEADLLKCYGRLWIALDEAGLSGRMKCQTEDVPAFDIRQDESSGALYLGNVLFSIDGEPCRLTRPLNSRRPWPLYLETDEDSIAVFHEDGRLSDELRDFLGE